MRFAHLVTVEADKQSQRMGAINVGVNDLQAPVLRPRVTGELFMRRSGSRNGSTATCVRRVPGRSFVAPMPRSRSGQWMSHWQLGNAPVTSAVMYLD